MAMLSLRVLPLISLTAHSANHLWNRSFLPRSRSLLEGYSAAPAMPTMVGAPGASSLPMQQINGVPRPPTLNPPPTASGGMSTPTSSGAGPMFMPGMYQANPTAAASGGFDAFNVSAASALPRVTPTGGASTTANPQDGFSYGQAPEFRDPSLDKSSSQ